MRIKNHILLLLCLTVGGAFGVATFVALTMTRLRAEEERIGEASVGYRMVQLYATRINATLPLLEIAAEEPEWAHQADPLIPRCISDLEQIRETEIFEEDDGLLGELAVAFDSTLRLCRKLGQDGDNATDDDFDEFEFRGDELLRLLGQLHLSYQEKDRILRARLEEGRSTVYLAIVLVSLGYLGFILLMWRWTVARIAAPVQALVEKATRSMDFDEPFVLGEDGPEEVRTMTRTVGSFVRSLEQRVQERTAEVDARSEELAGIADELRETNRTLEAAHRLAEAGTRAKSEFLANMSHEIRTPMTAILGYADLLSEQSLGKSDAESVQTIRRNGEYLLSILNDLLDLSKIEAGKIEIECLPCCPVVMIADVLSLMSVKAREMNLEIQASNATPIPETIRTDPTRVRQILINLLGNAIKFTEGGHVELAVTLVGATGKDPRLIFTVIDTGIGMTEDQVAKLFQPFVQADATTTRKFGGTGLGLTISKRFVEMLGGIIFAESEEGKGSRFTVSIPTGSLEGVKLDDRPIQEQLQLVRGSEVETRDVSQTPLECSILLAEDTPTNQKLIARILTGEGAEVDIADNGQIAVDMEREARAKGRPYDIILMDIQMPVMDGYKATRVLRSEGCTVPVIALTAHAMEKDRKQCMAVGCSGFATKPIEKKILLSAIRRCLPPGDSVLL